MRHDVDKGSVGAASKRAIDSISIEQNKVCGMINEWQADVFDAWRDFAGIKARSLTQPCHNKSQHGISYLMK